MLIVCAQVNVSTGRALGGSSEGTACFLFRASQKLTYQIAYDFVTHAGVQAGDKAELNGQAVLHVRSVNSDGTAEIEMVASGRGEHVSRLFTGGQPTRLQTEPWTLVLTMKSDGSITSLKDADGNQAAAIGLIRPAMTNAGAVLELQTITSYTLFGLQLPHKLPAPGAQWTGHQQNEETQFSDSSLVSVKLKPVTVKYTFVGSRKYKGRDCLMFSTKADGLLSYPATFYFDSKAGQLVGFEMHVKKAGADKTDLDLSAVLVKVE